MLPYVRAPAPAPSERIPSAPPTQAPPLPLGTLAVKAVRRLARFVGDAGSIHVFTWSTEAPPRDADDGPFSAVEVSPDQIGEVAIDLGKSPDDFKARLALGDRCFATLAGTVAVHARWVSARPTHVPELAAYVKPARDEVYVYDSFTVRAWRGHRATAVARDLMNRTLAGEGIRRGWAYVLSDNRSSLRALTAQHERAFVVRYLRVGRRRPWLLGKLRHPLLRA